MKQQKIPLNEKVRAAFWKKVRKYLMAGLLLWVPILATIWVIRFFVNLLDNIFLLLPGHHAPMLFGVYIPGLGVLLCVVIVFLTGMIATNFLGQYIVMWWDKLMGHIPGVRTIYAGVKQMMETLFGSGEKAFREVVLIEYPCKGTWSIAFQTGHAAPMINETTEDKMVSVFIPTTPNPTSGFLLYVPKGQTKKLHMSVDEALKMIVSLGVIQPVKKLS
jgi:uncharacterized membrane protein